MFFPEVGRLWLVQPHLHNAVLHFSFFSLTVLQIIDVISCQNHYNDWSSSLIMMPHQYTHDFQRKLSVKTWMLGNEDLFMYFMIHSKITFIYLCYKSKKLLLWKPLYMEGEGISMSDAEYQIGNSVLESNVLQVEPLFICILW